MACRINKHYSNKICHTLQYNAISTLSTLNPKPKYPVPGRKTQVYHPVPGRHKLPRISTSHIFVRNFNKITITPTKNKHLISTRNNKQKNNSYHMPHNFAPRSENKSEMVNLLYIVWYCNARYVCGGKSVYTLGRYFYPMHSTLKPFRTKSKLFHFLYYQEGDFYE